ncbi:MAG: biotin/lipoyl-containing protein, partial [Bdellovibrio sp.]
PSSYAGGFVFKGLEDLVPQFFEPTDSRSCIWVQKIGSSIWIFKSGQTFVVEASPAPKRGRKTQGSLEQADRILAPMPGKITQIFGKRGQIIEEDAPVLMMEAMKMEYTLKFGRRGLLSSISVEIGQQVKLGDLLAELTPESKSDEEPKNSESNNSGDRGPFSTKTKET